MAARALCAAIRRRLYGFARDLARPFADSRRARFVADMVPGLLIAGHVHLTKVARALSTGAGDVQYVGDPIVTQQVIGAGTVKRRDAK